MKKLRNFYFIAGLFAVAFALLTKLVPGITVTDFVNGFCWGLGVALLLAGVITSAIPHVCRKDKKAEEKKAEETASPAEESV